MRLCCLIYVHAIRAGVLPWLLVLLLSYIQDKFTPVYVAAQEGHVEALSLLISAGADINAANKVSYNILARKITVYDVTKSVATHTTV